MLNIEHYRLCPTTSLPNNAIAIWRRCAAKIRSRDYRAEISVGARIPIPTESSATAGETGYSADEIPHVRVCERLLLARA